MWAGLALVGMFRCTPDMLVFMFVIALSVLLIRYLQTLDARTAALMGALAGVAYLAKAAMFWVGLVYLGTALAKRSSIKNVLMMMVPFLIFSGGWVLALHHYRGRWTLGDAARLNYAWELDGAARTAHWQGEPGDIGAPLHPTRKIHSDPDIYEFSEPINVTYAPWYSPSYWYAGISPKIRPINQAKLLAKYLLYVVVLLFHTPGCAILLLGAALSKHLRQLLFRIRSFWLLLIPPIFMLLLYCLVYVDSRYVAGPVLVIGIVIIANVASLNRQAQESWSKLGRWAAVMTLCLALIPDRLAFIGAILHIPSSPFYDQQTSIAREMRTLGVRPGDRIAYVGLGINAYWALLDNVRVTAEVPVIVKRNGDLVNYIQDDYSNTDAFWHADSKTKEEIFALFRENQICAVVSDVVPFGADTSGWQKLNGISMTERSVISDVYVKMLGTGTR